MTWPFDGLPPLSYDVILADPATRFETYSSAGEGKSPQAHYSTMTWEELAALDVARLGRGDTILFLWACWPTLKHSLDLLDAWGFRYVTGGAWHKRTKHGKSAFGTGYVMRSATEPFLIGALGSPLTARNVRNVIETEDLDVIDAETRGHSRKPDEQYAVCERLAPRALRYVELFARQRRAGRGGSRVMTCRKTGKCIQCDEPVQRGGLCNRCLAAEIIARGDADDEQEYAEGPTFECAGHNDGSGFYCPLWGTEEWDWECTRR